MTTLVYKRLEGMALRFISGELERDEEEQGLSYTVTFSLPLDFTDFVHMSQQFIRDYLNEPGNAIRPEFAGFAYHEEYDGISDSAGKITSSKALCDVFVRPGRYLQEWSATELQHRYHKPAFVYDGGELQITARRDYRWAGGQQVEIPDLPIIQFEWALTLMEAGSDESRSRSVIPVVTFGDAYPEIVDVGNVPMRKGTRYMVGSSLRLGAIVEAQILTA